MTKRPTKAFDDAVKNTKSKTDEFEELLKRNPQRDKNNVEPRPKPPLRIEHPTLAPPGAATIKRNADQPRIIPSRPMLIEITKGDPDKDLFVNGIIRSMEGYSFTAKVNDLPSQFGIRGGKIDKLQIKHGERVAAQFDRGWDVRPQTADDRKALEKIRSVLDPPERKFKSIAPQSPDKDRGHER